MTFKTEMPSLFNLITWHQRFQGGAVSTPPQSSPLELPQLATVGSRKPDVALPGNPSKIGDKSAQSFLFDSSVYMTRVGRTGHLRLTPSLLVSKVLHLDQTIEPSGAR
jgi:hypothetical protein